MVTNTITLDICYFYNNTYISVKEDNINSNTILINITDKNLPYNLNNATVRMYFKGNTVSFVDATIIDALKGIVKVELTSSMLTSAGKFPCSITIYENGTEITADTFYLDVVDAIKDVDAIEASNEFTALTTALFKVETLVAEGLQGIDGKSAYEIALDNGFVGTEIEWIASLKGLKGDTGDQGIQGPIGPQGIQGPAGINGIDGQNGADGINGADGLDGDSAYEIAVNNGFVGTEIEWLASLEGPQGPQGIQGEQGPAGADGINGIDGAQGPAGPNLIDATTSTTLTGLLKGTGTNVTTAVAGTDYLTSADIPAGESVNVETLTDNKTLTTSSATYQILNPNGVNRTINLPTGTAICLKFIFFHTGPAYQNVNLVIKYNSTTICTLKPLANNYAFLWDGTTWIVNNNSTSTILIGDNARGRQNGITIGKNASSYCGYQNYGGVAIGDGANADDSWEPGVAIGRNAKANGTTGGYNAGIAVGTGTNANNSGVAVGFYADAENWGVAIGWRTDTNNKNYAIAKGPYSKCERCNEEWKCSDGASTNKYGYGNLNWHGETTTATPTEIFLGGISNQRATVLANSAYTFSLLCIAYCNAGKKGKSIKIEGGIRRDGANNTTLIGTPTTTILSEDGTTNYNITVSADDVNEALKITVTGADTETVRWNVTGQISECRF